VRYQSPDEVAQEKQIKLQIKLERMGKVNKGKEKGKCA
jgi:hypothetical protein